VDPELQRLIDLQDLDTRIAGLERDAARLPGEIDAIQAGVAQLRAQLEAARGRLDVARKSIRSKEKDLEYSAAKRTRAEARLWEVKTNKEYSAVLVEIDEIKQEKSRIEEEILSLMELGERLSAEIHDTEAQVQAREAQGRTDEERVRGRLAAVETELAQLRAARASLARGVSPSVLAEYEKVLRARGGLAVAQVLVPSQTCAGCRMAIRPQALLEIRAGSHLVACESCGRYLYWRDPA
jgi:hypothetical protein